MPLFAKIKGLASKATNSLKSNSSKNIAVTTGQENNHNFVDIIKDRIGSITIGCSCALIIFLLLVLAIVTYPLVIASSWFGGTLAGQAAESSSMSSAEVDEFYFNQSDGPWADVPYDASGGTIGQAGCGLVSITHCIDILTGNDFTPDEINEQLKEYYNGETAVYAPGGSSVPKLVEFAVGKYNLTSNHYTNIDEAIADMQSGNKVIICSDNRSGLNFIDPAGGKYSANHVIMAYKTDGENVWVKDSGRPNGNSVKYTKEEFSKIAFVGWYVLGTS